ncbi:MAG: DNA alkylation repair protein, partial [Gammaproteobacteria bacterium]
WTDDDSHHVRRLCSEGPRPRLPWASRLAMPRKPVFNILTALKADSSKYVQKSVANHLNDIGKADPEWLIEAMAGWQKRADKHTLWIINHALRTQIKAGDPKALALIGFKNADLTDLELTVNPAKVKIGSKLHATLTLSAPRRGTQALLIDWVMHYARKDRGSSAKVFKGRTIELKAGETFEWQKSFDMTPRRTRSLYPGAHKLEVQINGDVLASVPFTLTR